MRVCVAKSSNANVPVMLAEILRRDGKLSGIEDCVIRSAYARLLRLDEKQAKALSEKQKVVFDPKQVLGVVEIVFAVKPGVLEKKDHGLIKEVNWMELKARSEINGKVSGELLSTFVWGATNVAMSVMDKSQVSKKKYQRISDGLQKKVAGRFFDKTSQFGNGKPKDVQFLLTQVIDKTIQEHTTSAEDFCGKPPVGGTTP